jgi:hypothetical protein
MHNKNIYNEKLKDSNCAATIHCARKHFSYCAAAHPRSLEGTLTIAITVGGKEQIRAKSYELPLNVFESFSISRRN